MAPCTELISSRNAEDITHSRLAAAMGSDFAVQDESGSLQCAAVPRIPPPPLPTRALPPCSHPDIISFGVMGRATLDTCPAIPKDIQGEEQMSEWIAEHRGELVRAHGHLNLPESTGT